MGLIRNEAFVHALIEAGVVPPSTKNVTIRTTGDADGFVRISYEHTDEDGQPAITTQRIIAANARALDRIEWEPLLSEPPDVPSPKRPAD
jgi:hypothetical protein